MIRRQVDRSALIREPWLVWNAFVDLLAMEDYADLTPLQRMAHLAFWYDSEVQNGGHGQYFENRGRGRLHETILALQDLGLPDQARVLSSASSRLSEQPGGGWDEALEDTFVDHLDLAFHKCRPTVMEALERHLADHEAEYVEFP